MIAAWLLACRPEPSPVERPFEQEEAEAPLAPTPIAASVLPILSADALPVRIDTVLETCDDEGFHLVVETIGPADELRVQIGDVARTWTPVAAPAGSVWRQFEGILPTCGPFAIEALRDGSVVDRLDPVAP